MTTKKTLNKVARVSLMGGILGLMFTNPSRALDACLAKHNKLGWRSTFIVPHSEKNLIVMLFQLVVLAATLGLFTFGAGYLVMFEKESE